MNPPKEINNFANEEKGLTERGWRTIVIMKDLLLLESGFLLDFWAETIHTANYL